MNTLRDQRGQGTVEAAFVMPIALLLMMLLLQPGIILYDYVVMRGAAAEACRLVATSDVGGGEADSCVDFIMHRLAAVPQHEFFHVHEGGCTWFVQVEEGESSGTAVVWITNEVRPLPLFDAALKVMGVANASGNLEIGVSYAGSEQPDWLRRSVSGSPADWVGEW